MTASKTKDTSGDINADMLKALKIADETLNFAAHNLAETEPIAVSVRDAMIAQVLDCMRLVRAAIAKAEGGAR